MMTNFRPKAVKNGAMSLYEYFGIRKWMKVAKLKSRAQHETAARSQEIHTLEKIEELYQLYLQAKDNFNKKASNTNRLAYRDAKANWANTSLHRSSVPGTRHLPKGV